RGPTRDASRSVLRHRDLRVFQLARLASIVGVQIQSVAVAWDVYAITGNPLDLGLVGLAQFLPSVALALVAGHAGDRLDRRRITLFCHLAIAACSGLLLLHASAPSRDVAPMYAILVLFGVARAFLMPASQALLTHLVPVDELGRAIALNATTFQVAT